MFPVQHFLVGTPPHIFTMQLAWQSNNEKSSEINSAMTALSQVNNLPVSFLNNLQFSSVPCLFKTSDRWPVKHGGSAGDIHA